MQDKRKIGDKISSRINIIRKSSIIVAILLGMLTAFVCIVLPGFIIGDSFNIYIALIAVLSVYLLIRQIRILISIAKEKNSFSNILISFNNFIFIQLFLIVAVVLIYEIGK